MMTLLTPREKGIKCATELRKNIKLTNDGKIKLDEHGLPQHLSAEDRKYRNGYLNARKDEGKLFRWKEKRREKYYH